MYAIAKRGMLETADILAKDFANQNSNSSSSYVVPVFSSHPGWTETPGLKPLMEQHPSYSSISFRTVQDGTQGLLYTAVSPSLTQKDSGQFYFDGSKVPKHQPLALTRSTEKEVLKLNDFLNRFVV